jgi:hypothetical protein
LALEGLVTEPYAAGKIGSTRLRETPLSIGAPLKAIPTIVSIIVVPFLENPAVEGILALAVLDKLHMRLLTSDYESA